MAFVFPRGFPFHQQPGAFAFHNGFPFTDNVCEVRHSASGDGSCRASAMASSGFGCAGRQDFVRASDGPIQKFQVVDTPEATLIYFDATEFAKEDVKVSVTDGRLRLSAKKGENVTVENTWVLPEDALQDAITAKFSDDKELNITVPKQPKESFDVPIETEADQAQAPIPTSDHDPQAANPLQEEADGSWVEVDDVDVASARAKGKATVDSVIVDEAEPEAGPST